MEASALIVVRGHDMKYMIVSLLLVSFLIGCSSEYRIQKGTTYKGYSCRESFMHYYAQCSTEQITKEEFDARVQTCEKELANKICSGELAGLLWCMGRVIPDKWTLLGAGCDCTGWIADYRACRMKNGLFFEDKTFLHAK